jgi:hypothetical protein
VICADTNANIEPLTADELARRAISSASGPAGAENRDAILYLIEAKRHGVRTPLMPAYERRILEITGAEDLGAARESLRQKSALVARS